LPNNPLVGLTRSRLSGTRATKYETLLPFKHQRFISVQVIVRENNVDQALRALKKKMQREGIFRELKMRDHYEKPSEKKAREKAEAVRRARKLARKIAQKESGIAPPPRPGFKAGAGGARGAAGAGAGRPATSRPAI
jgi:small subunit ribosomal protein S21